MTEILPGVHVVDGLSGSAEFTTNVFLVKDAGPTWTMIDTGLPGADAKVTAYLAAHQIAPTSVRNILLTHLHRDHVGNLRAARALTQAKVHAHWIEAGFIAERPKYVGPGMPPAEPVEVDATFKDGDRIEAGGGLIAYHTPGHTPGHTSYYQPERKLLFSGDLFFHPPSGLGLTTPEYTLHMGTAEISARRLAGLSAESLMVYHGAPIKAGAAAKIRQLVDGFA